MAKIKVYTAVCQMTTGKKDSLGNYASFTVNGGTKADRDEAISVAYKHSSMKAKEAILLRVDESEIDECYC